MNKFSRERSNISYLEEGRLNTISPQILHPVQDGALGRSPANQGYWSGRGSVQRRFLRVWEDLTSELDLVHPLSHHSDSEVCGLCDTSRLIMLVSSRPAYASLQT